MATKTKVGIIGLGSIGTIHCDAYKSSGQAEIVAACDIDAAKLKSKADQFDVPRRYEDYRELLAGDVEAVSICVPNHLHMEIAVAALRAGKKVLLEKPMALNAQQAAKIVAAAEKAKGLLQVGMVRRQEAVSQVLRDYVQQGVFGDIYHLHLTFFRRRGVPGLGGWFTTKAKSGGGILIDCGVHLLDLAMWLSDLWKPTTVSARTYAKFGYKMKGYKYVNMWAGPPRYDGVCDVDDYASGFVRFGKDASMSFDFAWAANSDEHVAVEVLGDKGGTQFLNGQPLRILTEDKRGLVDICPKFNDGENMFHTQARRFLAACRGECPPAATMYQGLTVMKIIDAIYASSASGKEVAVKA